MGRMINEALETMRDLQQIGIVSKQTLRDFEAQAIRRLREHLHVSQSVFAAYLNASVSTVQKWENGEKKPSGAALRLLSVSCTPSAMRGPKRLKHGALDAQDLLQ